MLKLKILAVDDSPVITEMVRDAFEAQGYQVMTSADGVGALKTALSENPDLIIADINMPGLDGWELCSQIRHNPYTSFIPFIFLTSRSEAPDRIKGLQLGADDYLTKPFSMDELQARVKMIFTRILKSQEAAIARQSRSLSGTTRDMGLSDLIQMFAVNQKTGLLVMTQVGRPTGRIAFQGGRITWVEVGPARGPKALFRLLGWSDAEFEVKPLVDLDRDEMLDERPEGLLMEGVRQLDELRHMEKELRLAGKILRLNPALRPADSELSPREELVLEEIAKTANILELLDVLPFSDLDIYKVLAYFIRKGVMTLEDHN